MFDSSSRDENLEIFTEEEVQVSTAPQNTSSQATRWEKLTRYFILALAFLLPVWFLPMAGFSLSLGKSFLISTLVLAAFIFYLIHLLQKGNLFFSKNLAFLSLLVVLFVSLISSLFSETISNSFFGTGGETVTFYFIFLSVALLFLVTQVFRTEKDVLVLFSAVILSSALTFLIQLMHSLFGLSFGGILSAKTDTLVGSWNELAIFFSFIAMSSIVILEFFKNKLSLLSSGRMLRLSLFSVIGFSLLTMAFVNFSTVWIVFAAFLLVFFVYLFSVSGETTKIFARFSFFLILFSLFFILAQPMVGDLVGAMDFTALEVRPSWGATFDVVGETLTSGTKNFIFGSGPNTFLLDWLRYRPVDINQTIFWSVRFQYGIGLLPSLIATIGILGILSLISFLGFLIYYGLKTVSYRGDEVTKGLLFVSFLGAVYLWVFAIIYPLSHFLLILSFIITGIFFAMLARVGILKIKEVNFVNSGSRGFIFGLVVVFLLIGSVAGFYWVLQKYWAVSLYGRGLVAVNTRGDLEKGQEYISKAVRFDDQDRYFRSLSEIGLVRFSNFMNNQEGLSQEEILSNTQAFLGFTIQSARSAVDVNSSDPLNWFNLGQIYENFASIRIEGARQLALDSYVKAGDRSPSDPSPLLASGRVEIQAGNIEEARSFLESALRLKSNYTSALFLLAKIAAQEGNLDDAIRQTELARLTAPNDIGILFQLGLLYYQKENYKNASIAFQRAVGLNPNYSNARYFLGLSYDKLGQKSEAIEQFEAIAELNPGNAEVLSVLSNLRAGRSALSNISPPELAPEEREKLPIEEE